MDVLVNDFVDRHSLGSSTTSTRTFHPVDSLGLPCSEVCPQSSAWKDVPFNDYVDKHSPGSASEHPASTPEPVVEPDHRHSLLHLILRELHYWYPDGCPTLTSSGEFDPYTDSAQTFKAQLMELGPTFYSGRPLSAAVQHFEDRLSRQRLRIHGARKSFLVVYTTDGRHRLLVLKVPPRKFSSDESRWDHARRQMTFQDTADGLFAPGVRYTEKLFEWFRPGEESLERGCREGHRMEFVLKPPRYRRDNHPSCYEFADRSEANLLRSVGKGVLEGPLHYEPWSVIPLGSIYQPEKDKFRNVWNARASRVVNESLEPASADYDYLEDILKH
ncbi:hypothetical protein CYMTET_44477 [Cymbomonas tetramitiformis]|uniref:Uncharacterized protein n=1 Tax=Cymbomonas tetramitiformis TaxID=36881 RepID=A0AAE0C1C5_9CHLO|nr:hypothetical protein CYMTET_44477 [Cymbomonas tetramitiformis]